MRRGEQTLNEGSDIFSGADKGGYHRKSALNTRTRLEARQDLEDIIKYCKGYRGKNGSSDHDRTSGQNEESCIRLVVKLDTFSL